MGKLPVPPYLPDTEIGRQDIRRMYSNIKAMDNRVEVAMGLPRALDRVPDWVLQR